MNVYYETRKLQKLCDSFKEAQRQMGQASAKKLVMRLQELLAASTLADIRSTPPQRLHQLRGGSEEFAVMLHGGDRLVFRVGESPVPRLPDGGIDRGSVRSVVVTFAGDYHE